MKPENHYNMQQTLRTYEDMPKYQLVLLYLKKELSAADCNGKGSFQRGREGSGKEGPGKVMPDGAAGTYMFASDAILNHDKGRTPKTGS
jgi:hypothetical protein